MTWLVIILQIFALGLTFWLGILFGYQFSKSVHITYIEKLLRILKRNVGEDEVSAALRDLTEELQMAAIKSDLDKASNSR